MSAIDSFVTVQGVCAEYNVGGGLLGRLVGRGPQTHSVLRGVDFTLNHGDAAALFGLSGSGKTTLLRALAGIIRPSRGKIVINGKAPVDVKELAAGYVSSEETEPSKETVSEILHVFGRAHDTPNVSARIGDIAEALELSPVLYRPARFLATTERLKLNLARAALSRSPVILLDDAADELGSSIIRSLIPRLFHGRTVIVATRFPHTVDELGLPVLLLHHGTLVHSGTCADIAYDVGCPRVVDVWIEGLRYDLLRKLRNHAGVAEVRLVPTDQFEGQRLRITLRSSRYLPAMYDTVSQADLVKIEELPPSLVDVLATLAE